MRKPFVTFVFAASAAALLAACGGADSSTRTSAAPSATPAAPAVNPVTPTFVQTAVTNDIFEIDASRVALERSQNPAVKALAQEIIDARSRAGGELQMTLNEENLSIRPSTALPADKAQALAELRAADPSDVDELYLAAQVEIQEDALEALEEYAETGDTPKLKEFALKKAGEVREHRKAAESLKNRVS